MSDSTRGLFLGFIGVAIFSLTLPLSRIAVKSLDPVFISLGRTVLAAMVAAPFLLLRKKPIPSSDDFRQLAITAAGVVFGFPILSAIAMKYVPASHGGVVLGALPLATAVMSTIFAGERPSQHFWIWSFLGTVAVVTFALWDGGTSLQWGDALLFGALLAAAMGYAAGGNLARKFGGLQVISWALVISLPINLPLTLYVLPQDYASVPTEAWLSFLYLSLMSQFIGFYFWYRGLAIGGVARVGQIQLLQTFMTLTAAALINSEPLTVFTVGFAALVAICVWFGRKAKVGSTAK